MKIGFLEPHLRVCGGIRRVLELSNRLSDRGHDVRLYPEHTDNMSWFQPRNADVRPFSMLLEDELDVLIFNLESQWEQALAVTNAKHIVYYVLHAGFLYKYPEQCKASYQAFDGRIIANSKWTRDKITDFAKLKQPIPVVGGGINPNHFYPADVEKEVDVLTMGQPKDWKGHETVKEAVALTNCTMRTYYGRGWAQEKMGEEISRANVFVVGSWFEGWCQPGIEAMACGVPLISTRNGGVEEYATNEVNALLCPVKSPQAMADAIGRLMTDADLYAKLRKNGLETAEKWHWSLIVNDFERELKEIVYN